MIILRNALHIFKRSNIPLYDTRCSGLWMGPYGLTSLVHDLVLKKSKSMAFPSPVALDHLMPFLLMWSNNKSNVKESITAKERPVAVTFFSGTYLAIDLVGAGEASGELNMKHILKILALLVVVAATWITLLETSVVPHHYTWLVRSWFDAVSNMSPGSCTFAEGSILARFLFSDVLPLDAKPA
ncbi:hypothetical protein ZIOFF_028821 [Zingiber officinale]|uniref:Uncharacterized protein n=1 Tax=Zingiber officinale TaxID=94328 RepID=A0A8J5H071_ZINOF|nr:hypothetical protein ZIOFF_028821 [Zingiber officinale]